MMEDNCAAKAFLSGIFKEEVTELAPAVRLPKERYKGEIPEYFFNGCEYYLSATISLPDGDSRSILIELQKARFHSEILNYRTHTDRYYVNPNLLLSVGDIERVYRVFILDNDFNVFGNNCPVVYAKSRVEDLITKEEVSSCESDFILSLQDYLWVIQVNQIRRHSDTDTDTDIDLEKMLNIFNQDNYYVGNFHTMDIDENSYPKAYRPIIHRLHLAYKNEDMDRKMKQEDFNNLF
jgi:hypothetical protein